MHRAAAVDRPAVAVDPDDVDVGRPDRDALLQNLRALVDHRVEAALEDLVAADLALVDALGGAEVGDDLLDLRVGRRGAGFRVVDVVAAAVLLAAPAGFAEDLADVAGGRLLLVPADVEAGEIAHRERAHREAEVVQDAVHVVILGALQDDALRLLLALEEDPVADEAAADADQDRHLADLLGDRHRGVDHVLRRLLAAHDLQEAHDVGRREEVHADHVLGAAGGGRDLVHVERRGVRGQDGARLHDPVEAREDLLLEVHVLEHGLDHQVAVGEGLAVGHAVEQVHAPVDLFHRHAAAAGGALVVLADDAEAVVDPALLRLDDRHADAAVGEVHRDAAAHRAAAEDADLLDLPQRGVARHVGHLGRLALGEEVVALGDRLLAGHQLPEQLALVVERLVERHVEPGLDGADVRLRRLEAPRPPGDLAPEAVEDLLPVGARFVDLLLQVADLPERPVLGDQLLGEGDAALEHVFDDLVDQAAFERFRGVDRVAHDAHLERLRIADEPGKPLRAARARQDPQLDLGLAETGRGDADPVVAGHRRLQAAAERGAVDCGDNRLRRVLHRLDRLVQAGFLHRLAELGDVGAGDEGAALADQEHRGHLFIGFRLRQSFDHAGPDAVAERVDWRVVDHDQGDFAANFVVDHVGEWGHVPISPGAGAPVC